MPDVGDPQVYLTGATAILADYPEEIMEQVADPRAATRVLRDYPSLHDIRLACDRLFAPIEREAERRAAHKSHVAGLLPRPPRTPEQQARIDAQIARAKEAMAAAALPVEASSA
jgi:hypothetical protein